MFTLKRQNGDNFTFHQASDGGISGVDGPWPEESGLEFEVYGEIPAHPPASNAPDRVLTLAIARGLDVCHYDEQNCRTCFCDGSGKVIRCANQC